MSPAPLHDLLESLHAQLQAAGPVSPEDQPLLAALASDIERLREQSLAGPLPPPDTSLVARLNQAVQRFETSHPYITLGLSQLLDTLSRAGL